MSAEDFIKEYCRLNVLGCVKTSIKAKPSYLVKTPALPQITRLTPVNIELDSGCIRLHGIGGYTVYLGECLDYREATKLLSLQGVKMCPWKPYMDVSLLKNIILNKNLVYRQKGVTSIVNPLPIDTTYFYRNFFINLKPLEIKLFRKPTNIVVKEYSIPSVFKCLKGSLRIRVVDRGVYFHIGEESLYINLGSIREARTIDNYSIRVDSDKAIVYISTLKPIMYVNVFDEVFIKTDWFNALIYTLNPYYIHTCKQILSIGDKVLGLWISLWNTFFIGIANPLLREIEFIDKGVKLGNGEYYIVLASQRKHYELHNLSLASIQKPLLLENYRSLHEDISLIEYIPRTILLTDIVYSGDSVSMVFFNPDNMCKKLRITSIMEIVEARVYSYRFPNGILINKYRPNIVETVVKPYEIIIVKLLIGEANIGYYLVKRLWRKRIGVQ